MRLLDLECAKCGTLLRDQFFRKVPSKITHRMTDKQSRCRGVMVQVFLPVRRGGQWSDRDAVVVFRKPDGTIAYPTRNDAPTPKGCERVEMKSLREVERFEKANGVRCEALHYNSGNGAEIIDHVDNLPSVEKRQEAFMRAYLGRA